MKSSFRFTPDAAMAAPTAASLSYIRSGVDMSVAERDRTLDDRLGIGSRHPEGAEAEAGNRDTLCRDRLHDVFLSRISRRRVGALVLLCCRQAASHHKGGGVRR